jgi:DNA-directed RNA polymerase specialized sigma24 family protein
MARTASQLAETAALVRRAGRRAQQIEADIGEPGAPSLIAAEVLAEPGAVDILVNNAATVDPTVPLEAGDWDRLPDRFGPDPARESEWRDLVRALRRAVAEELTEHQRRVFTAIAVDGVPLDALVAELRSSRNALYKTMFDARRKLRACLVANGFLHENPVRHS